MHQALADRKSFWSTRWTNLCDIHFVVHSTVNEGSTTRAVDFACVHGCSRLDQETGRFKIMTVNTCNRDRSDTVDVRTMQVRVRWMPTDEHSYMTAALHMNIETCRVSNDPPRCLLRVSTRVFSLQLEIRKAECRTRLRMFESLILVRCEHEVWSRESVRPQVERE
jgi:hypothetical protein